MTPQEFAQRLNRLYAGTMMQDMEMLHAGEGRARGRVEFKPHLRQLTGLFHAGVIMGLADTTATAAAMWEMTPIRRSTALPPGTPLSIQVSTNLIRNTGSGALTADAELVHRGKSTIVADVRVTDDQSRLIAKATVTLLVPKRPRALKSSRASTKLSVAKFVGQAPQHSLVRRHFAPWPDRRRAFGQRMFWRRA